MSLRNLSSVVAVVVVCLLALPLASCTRETRPAAASPSLTVEVVQPKLQSVTREVQASGAVVAGEEIQLGSELNGVRVDTVSVDVGDTVRKGDVLVRLDARTVSAELARADAAVVEAQATLVLAETRARRTKALVADALVPAQDVDDVVASEARARAQLDTAQANRQAAALRVEFAVVRAPENGVVASRSVQPGQLVGTGELLRLIRDGRLEWRAELDEHDLPKVAMGGTVSVTAADGARVTGQVRRIAPGLDPGRRTGTVYVTLPRPGTLRAGTFAEGRLAIGMAEVLTIPAEAVVRRDGRAYVFLVDQDQRARERLVALGVAVGTDIEVLDGLALGEAVVARGAGFLNDGDLLRVVGDDARGVTSGKAGA